jgi:hypothetical protein
MRTEDRVSDNRDYYAGFLNALAGLIDDAEMSNYDTDGLQHLREAEEYFRSHWRTIKHAREQDAARGFTES